MLTNVLRFLGCRVYSAGASSKIPLDQIRSVRKGDRLNVARVHLSPIITGAVFIGMELRNF